MSKASRLARPSGTGSKLPSPRKESPAGGSGGGSVVVAGRARVVSVGEKLMRAGSDGGGGATRLKAPASTSPASPNSPAPQGKRQTQTQTQGMDALPPRSRISPPKASAHTPTSEHKQTKGNLKVTSPEEADHLIRRQASPNGTPSRSHTPASASSTPASASSTPASAADAKASSRSAPRRHTVGGPRSSRDILAMQPPDMDKKREAFLEHLKQKYPHHASAIMGHQERLREQSLQNMLSSLHTELDIQKYLLKIQSPDRGRSPKHGPSPVPGVGEQAEYLSLASIESLDTMSEADAPSAFTRGSRSRASLPVVRSTNQTKDRSLGVLYLQYGDETKQIRMPNEITSSDTVRALFVSAFPQQLTMKMLESPSVAVYVKDDMRNMYYELSDVRNITDHSCLKVYHKDPAQAFSHGPRPSNGDARMHREMMYGSRDVQHPLRQPPMGPPPLHPMQGPPPLHPMQGPMSPPTPHSLPPSPSRIPFGPRQGPLPASATIPRDRIPTASPSVRSVSPCPSAILERRDVKPDEDMGGGKSHSLTRGNEGLYADPYLLHEGRMSLASAHVGHPSPGESPEHGLVGYHRASIRSTGSYSGPSPTDTMEHPSLYRQKSRNSQLPTLGSKTPPPSPHRMTEVRMIDIHGGPPPHGGVPPPHAMHMERSSPVRQSFRKEELPTKSRSNMGSPVVVDLQGHGPLPPANDPQTRQRMKAMEQQIASLTGLVQHALLKSPNSSGTEEPGSERSTKTASPSPSSQSAGGSPVLAVRSVSEAAPSAPTPAPSPVYDNLLQFRTNVIDLRQQLQQMRQQQLQNQESLRAQLKRAEQEISSRMEEALRGVEDPVQRQRVLVEEDRHKYLSLEERVQTQLRELEQYVDCLKSESSVAGGNRAVTLKDVEEGAVSLRRVGESLAGLKGEFPALQTRMRAVLRVEVEAVKFLKEEPHKLDSMLKRVKVLTEVLSSLRRYSTEGHQKPPDSELCAPVKPAPPVNLQTDTPVDPPPPQAATKPGSPSALPEPQTSTVRSEVMPASPVVIHHVQSSRVLMQQSQQSAALTLQPSPPLTPSSTPTPVGSARVSPSLSTSDPPSPAPQHKKSQPSNPEQPVPVNTSANGNQQQSLFIEELHNSSSKNKNRAESIQAAEKEWEERRQNLGHYDGKEFEKILQEAQANMMKGIPSLEVGSEGETPLTAPPAAPGDQTDCPQAESPPTDRPEPDYLQADCLQPVEPDTVADPKPESTTDIPAKPGPEKLPKLVLEESIKPATTEKPPSPVPGDQPTPQPSTDPPATDKVSKQGAEKFIKSPPPPPPRKTFPTPLPSGMTTTRSGEVVYTSRKDSLPAQEGEEVHQTPTPPPKPTKVPPEIKPKPSTPPPVAVSAVKEEEDEGDKIMAELQVFQKCTIKDVGVKSVLEPARIEPQIRELRPGALMPLKDRKSSEHTREDKHPGTDENGNSTVRQSPGVIYYVTGQISKEQPTAPAAPGSEEAPESREPLSTSQVSNVTPNDNSPARQQPPQSKSQTGPPISPKPLGLNGFFPGSQKLLKRSDSLNKNLVKTSAAPATSVVLSPVEKRVELSLVQGIRSTSKIVMPATGMEILPPVAKVTKSAEAPLEKAALEKVPSTAMSDEGDEEASLSQDLPGEEAPPPPDNIAFMITNTKVQALSRGEYQELVNAKKGSVQTVTVGNRDGGHVSAQQDNGFGNKKPVIIIFDEPMDIRSAYKRLSTVFECEEEMERMLAEEGIPEESEESDTERSSVGVDLSKGGMEGGNGTVGKDGLDSSSQVTSVQTSMSHSSSSSSSSELTGGSSSTETGDGKTDGKKKFKFKFPKKQFAALSQALRSGTKSGKKTLQVVVYEDEEEADGTVRQYKEAKRFEITRSKSSVSMDSNMGPTPVKKDLVESNCRSDDICKSTYKTLDSLEQTIKQLETTISEMGPSAAEEPAPSSRTEEVKTVGSGLQRSFSLPTKGRGLKANKAPLKKKGRPQLLPRPAIIPTATVTPVATQQNVSVASPTSRMPVPMAVKSRQSPTDKAGKQPKLQDAQRQFRQANGSAKRVGEDHKTTSPTLPASKIPSFYPSTAKGSSQSVPNSDATNPINPSSTLSSSSSTSTKSSIPSPLPLRSGSTPSSSSSHIPSLSNGPLRIPAPHSHIGKALSFSSQTPNGRVPSSSFSSSSSSSTSPSPLSPTPLGPGAKSIRTIHTPSFTSYRPHHGSNGKSCIPTATAAKDST